MSCAKNPPEKKLIFRKEFITGMKIFKSILLIIVSALMYLSCQKELFFDGTSSGALKKDASGNCSLVSVDGIFKADTVLTSANFIDVQVDVSLPGTYDIKSDTVNGYSFSNTGTVVKGANTIRLYASGKPIAGGKNNFTVTYGTSTCNFNITVSATSVAVFTLGGAPNICTGAIENGTYIKGIALTSANTITVQANVTVPGRYSLTASTANGFLFSGNGIFIFPGIQNVTLTGTGTPIRAEVSNITVTNIVSTCNFSITVLDATDGKALFSFDGTPGACINFTVNGTYYAGIAATVNNTVIMNVTVTKSGSYDLITNTANGITFNNAGSFISTGQQTVTLSATGRPLRSEATAFIPNTGTQSCNFSVNILPMPPPAVFTLSGAPNACTSVTVNGFYIVSKLLDPANTVVIQVDVSTPGSYTLSTNTVNGMTFSVAGVFTVSGLQNVILQGSGIPQTAGISILTPRFNVSACTFSITVV